MRRRLMVGLFVLSGLLVCVGLAGCKAAEKQPSEPIKASQEAPPDEQRSAAAPEPSEAPAEKVKITRLDELPKHTYPCDTPPSELVRSEEKIMALAEEVEADVRSTLGKYEIEDPTTLQRLHGTLLTIELLEGDYDAALNRIEKIRGMESKEAARLLTGLSTQAMIAAEREAGGDTESESYKAAYVRQLTRRVRALPWSVVQESIQESKGRLEIFSETLITGLIQAQMDPVCDKTGELSDAMAESLLGLHFMLERRMPLKNQTLVVYQKLIDENQQEKPDIWAARSVSFEGTEGHEPVLLGVWDSGTDTGVFADCLWVNPDERLDGTDTDGNGFIDDVHGIAFDIHAHRTTGMLCPLEGAEERMPDVMQHMKGFMDLQAAVDSPEASALKRHLSSLNPEDVQGFIEDLGLAGNYAHGTHVAGIMAAGNPYADLLIARLSYDHRMKPVARTVEWGRRDGEKCLDTVEYFKDHGVRVVNMSWGEAQQDAEDSLERNGIGNSAEERREIARKVFALQKEGLYHAIENAPNILFVCAAGNSDNDVEFDEYIPSSFDLPNLITVGAVDQSGNPTSFTSFGRTVEVYANGYEVESFVPGGERMKMSGTSMASPNVANLAGKLLAVDPSLTPTQVIDLIKRGSDRVTKGEHTFLLINPKATLALLDT